MNSYFGILRILGVDNISPTLLPANMGDTSFIPLDADSIKFVHYPDCQQLIIWLPQYGRSYNSLLLRNLVNNDIVYEAPITDKLSGSIQLIWDTVDIAPGDYRLEITWQVGYAHHIRLTKESSEISEDNAQQKAIDTPVPSQPNMTAPPTLQVYRDGFGNIIEDEAEKIRKDALNKILHSFTQQLAYSGTFYSGTITYTAHPDIRIDFEHEMAGGNDMMFFIYIPSQANWERQTQTSITMRGDILSFVARQVQRDKAIDTRYEIKEDTICFYHQ